MSFSEFDFKWSVHIIDAYTCTKSSTHTCYPHLNFLFEVNDLLLFIMAMRIANTNHASCHKYGYMHTELSIAMCNTCNTNETTPV